MLPRLDAFFIVFIMSIIMFGTRKSSVATTSRWINKPCLVPFLHWVAPADLEAFRAEANERIVRSRLKANSWSRRRRREESQHSATNRRSETPHFVPYNI